MNYPPEVLAEDDDGTMTDSREALEQAVVGHKIVKVEQGPARDGYHGLYGGDTQTVITLDNGQKVVMVGVGDCCAFTDVQAFLLHPDKVDHIITGVGTTDGYTTWHVYADMGDVLELTVNWSCGNPFYYAYGFQIQVEPVDGHSPS